MAAKRPIRALRKIGRGILEFFGLGKQGVMFEEMFGISLVRALRHAMENHPIIVASKVPLGDRSAPRRSAAIEIEAGDRVQRGVALAVRARITNAGSDTWHAASRSGTGHVTLGVQLLDDAGRLMERNHYRVPLPNDVSPGAVVALSFDCPAPDSPGLYIVKFDMVAEGLMWFEAAGSRVVTRKLTVA